eukprot:CAMPEP_0113445632 /NCGR_PEP_ID=MMETSP0014_2-20120614/3288_1 /TAXON_ID=2857 /ORGANISM="Nitzschia sp." /LENGTH=697 /DNA_ID=CAMNT_0000336693 /DNA_START=410 /DNA_END=2503 /DNA_ORIENTATION=+ /assembly_acc=CAM_ASM_000159
MASPFSFHCMICFEEFDIDKRYPVVLPCGHTYICNECANRLDKCMECRTPLVEYHPRKTTAAGGGAAAGGVGAAGGAGGRAGVVRGRPGHPPPAVEPLKVKKRTVLPKNVVLMSLIEATEVAAENVQSQNHQPSMQESPMIKPSVLDIEEDEEEKIRASTTIAISDCGTYAVAAKDGLEIFPSRPESLMSPSGNSNNNTEHTMEDVDTLVRFYQMEHKLDLDGAAGGGSGSGVRRGVSGSGSGEGAGDGSDDVTVQASSTAAAPPFTKSTGPNLADNPQSSCNEDKKMEDNDTGPDNKIATATVAITAVPATGAPPGRLSWGDRVQIVSMKNGWAKLARGYGFVQAGHNHLVKVGGSVDRSCKLEAMLRQLSTKRKSLREEQKRVDNQFIALMNELQVSLMADEDMTVIAADTFHKNLENDPSAASLSLGSRDAMLDSSLDMSAHEQQQQQQQQQQAQANNNNNNSSSTYDEHTPLKPRFMERPMTPPGDSSTYRGLFCSGSDVFNAVLPMSSTRAQPPALPSTSRSPAIAHEFNSTQQTNTTTTTTTNSNNTIHQTHSTSPVGPAYSHSPTTNIENTPTRILTSVSNPSPSALRAGARAWREMHGRPASDRVDFRTGMSGHSAVFSSSAHTHNFVAQSRALWAGMSNHTGLSMWKSSTRKPIASNGGGSNGIQQPSLPAFPASGSSDSRNDAGSMD